MRKTEQIEKLALSSVCLALCLLFPFLTGQLPQLGNRLSPMHIPVLLCGFLCGWPYGLMVGLIAPPLRFLLFGMPPLFPVGAAMAVELAVYGAATGAFYQLFPPKNWALYASLVIAMLLGRLAWGAVQYIFLWAGATEFSFEIFLTNAFLNAWPGMICHILLIPPIVMALRKARILRK